MDSNTAENVCFFIIAILSTALNVFEIKTISCRPGILKAFEKLLLSLSIGDLIISSCTVIFMLLVFAEAVDKRTSPRVFHLVLVASMGLSYWNIIAITVDRYFAVRYPIRHNIKMRPKFVNGVVAVIWLMAVKFTVVLGLVIYYKFHTVTYLMICAINVLLIGVMFGLIYFYLFKRTMQSRLQTIQGSSSKTTCSITELRTEQRRRPERNLLITSSLVVATFVAANYPFAIEMLVQQRLDFSFSSQLCLLLNCALDPLVYFYKGYRERKQKSRR